MALTSMKGAMRKVKDLQYTEIEIKVRNATNNDPWGVQRSLMAEIAAATNSYDDYPKLFKMLWDRRLVDENHVMHVQKSLALVEYLLCNGSDRFIRDAKQRSMDIYRLQRYSHKNADAEDDAGDARALAVKVYALLTDEEKLKEERSKADRMRKLHLGTGISNENYGTHHTQPHHTHHSGGQGHHNHHAQTHHNSRPTPTKHQHHPQHHKNQPEALATHGLRSDIASRYESHAAPDSGEADGDDPFGAPPTLGGGSGTTASSSTQPTTSSSATKKKTKKKSTPAKTPQTAPTTTSAADDDDPFGAAPTLNVASAQYAAHARKPSKQSVLAAFGDEPQPAAATKPPMPRQKSDDLISGPLASLSVSEPIVDLFAPEPAEDPAQSNSNEDLWAAASADAFDITKEKKAPSKPVTAPGKKTLAERAAADPMSLFDQPSKTAPAQSNPFGASGMAQQNLFGAQMSQQNPFGAPMGGAYVQNGAPMGGAYVQRAPQPARPDPFAAVGAQPPSGAGAGGPDPFSGLF